MVLLTQEICKRCYYSSEQSEGCCYMSETGKSRLKGADGKRYDPKYCDKFKDGSKGHGENWKKRHMGNYRI